MRRRALFPISLSNQRFSTLTVVPALESIVTLYDDFAFLIADRLQSYNRAIAAAAAYSATSSEYDKKEMFAQANELVGTFSERRKWLEKVKARLGVQSQVVSWHVLSVDDVADAKSFAILRRLDILFGIDSRFRKDVMDAADQYSAKHPQHVHEIARLLSARYIIEELALSIRMRVQRRYFDEYYIGETLRPARNVYRGCYMASPWELAGLKEGSYTFRFFELSSATDGSNYWSQVD